MKREQRWMPWWGAFLLGIPVIGGSSVMLAGIAGGTASPWQLPVFVVLIGLWLVAVLGRSVTLADERGVAIRNRPVWSGAARERVVERIAVARLMVRRVPGYKGVYDYYAACELQTGDWVNLSGPYAGREAAARDADELARLWDWPREAIAELNGWPAGARGPIRAALVPVAWGGALAAALAWAMYVELHWR